MWIALEAEPPSKSSRNGLGPQPGDRRREAGRVVHAGRPAEEFLRLAGTEVLVRAEHVHRLPREQGRGLEPCDLAQQPVAGLEGEPDGVCHAVGRAEPDRGIPEAQGQAVGELLPRDAHAVADVEGMTGGAVVAQGQERGIDEVVDVTYTRDGASAVDEE